MLESRLKFYHAQLCDLGQYSKLFVNCVIYSIEFHELTSIKHSGFCLAPFKACILVLSTAANTIVTIIDTYYYSKGKHLLHFFHLCGNKN